MIAIISDIHGNYTALLEVLKKIDSMNIDKIYCLGDTVGYYSQVNECCNELRKRNVIAVMGNHDLYLATDTKCERSKSVNDCLEYQKMIITQDNLNWIKKCPHIITEGDITFVHGGWNDYIDEYLYPSEEYFHGMNEKYFVSGHTHIQLLKKYNDKRYCNPGSVGQPRDGNNKAAFAIFDGNNFFLHRVSYDIEKVGKLMNEIGFSGYYYGCLKTGAAHLQWAEDSMDRTKNMNRNV
jgi:putative phosphoesterase